jgi:uncharacterized membrane protein
MANQAVRERLAQDVSAWLVDGLISRPAHDVLRERYGAAGLGVGQAVKTLGIAGGILAFFGLLGLVAAMSRSQVVGALLMLASGAMLTAWGLRLALDKLGRYSNSSKSLLMLGVTTAALGMGLGVDGMGVHGQQTVFVTGFLVVVPLIFLAYRFSNTFLLVLGLIALFHWVGSWTEMLGRSTYGVFIEDPRVMSLFALGAVVVGVYHERELRFSTGRFYQAYETVGLIYLNLSLLGLTIVAHGGWGSREMWIAVLSAAAIAEIVAGARLHNPLLTGFGVTIFAINIFTRYYERFWNRLHRGEFFLLGGLSLFAAGMACEVILRRMQRRTT